VTLCLTWIFKEAQCICSHEDFPLSLYILLVQAMKNEVDVGLTKNDNEFTCVLGLGAVREVMNTIDITF
jgi:hypothetical protein